MINVRKIAKLIIGDNLYWKLKFFYATKKWPNIYDPTFFNEKVRWRMLHDQNYLYVKCADKYEVRNYIEKKIGSEYLVPLRYMFTNNDDITDKCILSNSVAKSNHGAGMIEFIPETYSLSELKNTFGKWLNLDYTSESNEKHYSRIPRKILIEESLCKEGKPPVDYKFHTFKQADGSFRFVLQLVNGRFHNESRGYYLEDLNKCIWSHGEGFHSIPQEHIKPLKKAMELSSILCEDFNYVRVDWYIYDNKLYFGELTFTPGAGSSYEFGNKLEKLMAKYWQL
ncbi:hypothetical protein DVI68_02900 [Escherichia coli]|nr:hypothetical protein [Escherichia coli]EEW8773326.1 hypothetical protein [Escherichia coli]EEZ9632306.1 hypothetical protein [Escherichia coli]EFH7531430.1 hypothetical protein [Escherichia coli]EFO1768868.1 hypothetical protein [Escherichia coli]